MSGGTPEGIKQVIMGNEGGMQIQGFAIFRNLTYKDFPFLCLTPDVMAARKLVQKNLEIHHELFDNPPFPAWKDGL